MDKKYENDIMMVEIDVDKITQVESNVMSAAGNWCGSWCGNYCWGIYCTYP